MVTQECDSYCHTRGSEQLKSRLIQTRSSQPLQLHSCTSCTQKVRAMQNLMILNGSNATHLATLMRLEYIGTRLVASPHPTIATAR